MRPFDPAQTPPFDPAQTPPFDPAQMPPFDPAGPLPTGVTVLEASAGTGKTFTIAALASRFIAEGAARPDELLLATFTRAATGELRERVYERLVSTERELARAVAGAARTYTDAVAELLSGGPREAVRERQRRLAEAIANFDALTIETTHGFCQRILDGLGTLAQSDPGARFVESVDQLAKEVLDDLYLRRFYNAPDAPSLRYADAQAIAKVAIANPLSPVLPPPDSPGQDAVESMRARLAIKVRDELETRKRALSLLTHDDQLTRLLETLRGPHGDAAVASVRERFRVVMIDEFQDTDPIQWEVLYRAFGGPGATLVLIGDPKQAIYAFRGADVYAYLAAAHAAPTRATLHVNWRSDQPLLDGLDALFGNARLGHPDIVYRRVRATAANQTTRLAGPGAQRALRIRVLDSAEPGLEHGKSGHVGAQSAREWIARDLAADIASLFASDPPLRIEPREAGEGEFTELSAGSIAVLVRTHRNAALIKRSLEAAGVPAVIGSSGSVFDTEAANHWLRLLLALERPTSSTRANAAALTSLIGWSAAQLAAAGESAREELHQRLHAWARILREQGVAALARATLGGAAAERILAQAGGERLLTDLDHVAELLAAAADRERLGVASLTGWLRQRIDEPDREGASDERSRRLDSDADAVQVLTFHRSKGSEHPIVYCPFLWEPGRQAEDGEPVAFHDDNGERAIDVGVNSGRYLKHLSRHQDERRGEELRLAYVALTRARHQVVIWWASTWQACESPLGRLLFARGADGHVASTADHRPRDEEALARLRELEQAAPHALTVERARIAPTPHRAPREQPTELERARFTRRLDSTWRRTSYSALTAAAHDALVASEPETAWVADEPDAPTVVTPATDSPELPLGAMAAGTRLGTLIHETLRLLDFTDADLAGALRALLERSSRHRPSLLGCAPGVAAEGLALALATPLGGQLGSRSLTGIPRSDRLDELSFELPLAGGEEPTPAAACLLDIASLLETELPAEDPARPYAERLREPTLAAELRGYLTGSIDLVARVRASGAHARHVIVDYKTNWLAPAGEPLAAEHYAPARLALEMERSHYLLQALLYSVALHRYLRWRLPGYDPEVHLGGVRYLFLRGMLGPTRPGFGVFAWDPPAALIVAVSDLLAGGGCR